MPRRFFENHAPKFYWAFVYPCTENPVIVYLNNNGTHEWYEMCGGSDYIPTHEVTVLSQPLRFKDCILKQDQRKNFDENHTLLAKTATPRKNSVVKATRKRNSSDRKN